MRQCPASLIPCDGDGHQLWHKELSRFRDVRDGATFGSGFSLYFKVDDEHALDGRFNLVRFSGGNVVYLIVYTRGESVSVSPVQGGLSGGVADARSA